MWIKKQYLGQREHLGIVLNAVEKGSLELGVIFVTALWHHVYTDVLGVLAMLVLALVGLKRITNVVLAVMEKPG